MDIVEYFGNLFLLTFSIFAGLVLAFRISWPIIKAQMYRMLSLESSKNHSKEMLQLKLTAYERLLLFSHRISPEQLLKRNQENFGKMNVEMFAQLILAEIDGEFQHNFAQQLYVSDNAWAAVHTLKENSQALYRNLAAQMGDKADTKGYMSAILSQVEEIKPNPYAEVQKILKQEMAAV